MAAEPGGWRVLRGLSKESPLRAVVVTGIVCVVCSALVATAVTVLRPYHLARRAAERESHVEAILASVPGLADVVGSTAGLRLEAWLVELATGATVVDADPTGFDARAAAREPATSIALPAERDLAGIGRRARHAVVYVVSVAGRRRLVVLPVHGAGYVSTLYGYLALDPDGETVRGLTFYEQGETPGLGSEVQNADWLAGWAGKRVRDETGTLRLGVAHGRVAAGDPAAPYLVDGLSGATRTANGVTNLLRFWLGPDGFGPFLERLAREGHE